MTVLRPSRQCFLLAFLTTLFLYVNCAPLKVACATTTDRFKVEGTGTSCKTIPITNNEKRERYSNDQHPNWPITLAGSRPAPPGLSQSISMLKPRSDPTRPPNGWEPPVPNPNIPSQTPPQSSTQGFRHYDPAAEDFGQSAARQLRDTRRQLRETHQRNMRMMNPMTPHMTVFRVEHPGPAPAPPAPAPPAPAPPAPAPPGPQHPSAPQPPPGTMAPSQMHLYPPNNYDGNASGLYGPSVPQHPPAPLAHHHQGTIGSAQMHINPAGTHHSGGSGSSSNHPHQFAPSRSQSPRPNSPSNSTPQSRKGKGKGKGKQPVKGKGKSKGKGAKRAASGSPGSPGPSSKMPRH